MDENPDYEKLYVKKCHECELLQEKTAQLEAQAKLQKTMLSQQHGLIEQQQSMISQQQKRIAELESQHHRDATAPTVTGMSPSPTYPHISSPENTIRFGNQAIAYSVTRSHRRKTTEIIIGMKGIEVKTPTHTPDSEIRKFLASHRNWILKKQKKFDELRKNKSQAGKPKTVQYVEERVHSLASRIGVRPSNVIFKHLQSRWGSCDYGGVITLNLALLNAPSKVIDYVIIHELCHINIQNHSPEFWNMLCRYDPAYETKKRWLGNEGLLLLPQNRDVDEDITDAD